MSLPQASSDIRIGGGRRSLMGLAGAAAFVVFGLALIFAPNAGVIQRAIGASEILFFGPLPLYWAVRLYRVGCIYVFADDGIRFPMHEWPTLPWSQIMGTRIVTRRGRRYLAIYVHDAESRIRNVKRGARMARWNLRHELGLVAIPEQLAPVSLEALQTEITRRQSGVSPITAPAQGLQTSVATVLPVSVVRGTAPSGSVRSLRLVAGLHGLILLTSAAGGHHSGAHRALAVALGGALLLGAWLVSAAPLAAALGVVVASEAGLVMLDLTAGHHVAVATRVLYLFFPVCVLLVAAQAWPRRRA